MTAPTDYADLELWFDASQESFANNDPVTVITDRSANGYNTTAAVGTPLFKTGVFPLGGPAFDLDGTDDYFTLGSLGAFITASAFTFFAVIIVDAIDTDHSVNMYQNDCLIGVSSSVCAFGSMRSTGPVIGAYIYDVHAPVTIAYSTPYVMMNRLDGGSIYTSINGGTEASVVSGDSGTTGDVYLGRASVANYFNGQVGELFIYSSVRSTGEITALNTYLSEKWISAAAPTGPPLPLRIAR